MAYRESWRDQGACQALQVTDPLLWASFYGPTTTARKPAKAVCDECPVKRLCLGDALSRGEVWGVWGGCDEVDLRRTLGVDTNGVPRERHKLPRCPLCRAEVNNLRAAGNGVSCTKCDFSWTASTSAEAVRRGSPPEPAVKAAPAEKPAKAPGRGSPVRVTVPRRRIASGGAPRPRRVVQLPLPSAAPVAALEAIAASSGPRPSAAT